MVESDRGGYPVEPGREGVGVAQPGKRLGGAQQSDLGEVVGFGVVVQHAEQVAVEAGAVLLRHHGRIESRAHLDIHEW